MISVVLPFASSALATSAGSRAAAETPETCKTAFSCGALGAGSLDKRAGLRALKRGCDIETTSPIPGDSLFACEQYASILINAGAENGGDAARGLSMLEAQCKARPVITPGVPSPCNTLARTYDRPPRASGLPRKTDKAAALRAAGCDVGDSLECSALGDLYLNGGPGFPVDVAKGRAAYDKGCGSGDTYAAGVCGELASKLLKGQMGGPPDRAGAMPLLQKSCSQGYRCDLYIELLLQDHRDAEAVAIFDNPRSLAPMRDEWGEKYCREGYTVMCNRPKSRRSPASPGF